MTNDEKCTHCGIGGNGCGDGHHAPLCCDCFDLSWGMDLAAVNAERASKCLPPIAKPWPAQDKAVQP